MYMLQPRKLNLWICLTALKIYYILWPTREFTLKSHTFDIVIVIVVTEISILQLFVMICSQWVAIWESDDLVIHK